MHLAKLYSKFNSRCKSYNTRVIEINSREGHLKSWEFNYQTEVLISDIWQSWCHFTRKLLFSSCRGTIARDGTVVVPRNADNSWQRLGYEAKQGVQNQNAKDSGHLNFMIRQEPTWGDLNSAVKIIASLQPSNQNNLLSAFGSFSGLKDLQVVRNACAHKNIETFNSILPLASRYNFSLPANATQVAWARVKGSNDYAIEQWIFEMNKIADFATSRS